MKIILNTAILSFLALVSGCTSTQDITKIQDSPKNVCIVKHDAVKNGVLEAIQAGFASKKIPTTVVDGIYEKKHGMWQPRWYVNQVSTCDSLCFYVANWNWDLAMYMYYANIWMTDSQGSRKLGQASYDASRNAGLGKFINADNKITELMNQMLGDVSGSVH